MPEQSTVLGKFDESWSSKGHGEHNSSKVFIQVNILVLEDDVFVWILRVKRIAVSLLWEYWGLKVLILVQVLKNIYLIAIVSFFNEYYHSNDDKQANRQDNIKNCAGIAILRLK
jgi:hypothetical protein